MPTTRARHGDGRYQFLDLLRFAAAAAVVVYHYGFRGWAADGMSAVRFDALGEVARYGFLGVQLFFIISGFVIAASAEGRGAGEFVRARARRLYPAFWVGCAVTTLASIAFAERQYAITLPQLLANLTLFASELRQPYVDGAYWSLTVEIHFYALVALVLAARRGRQLDLVLLGWLGLAVVNLARQLPGDFALALAYAPLFAAGAAYSALARGRATWRSWAAIAVGAPASAAYAARTAAEMTAHYHASISPAVCAGAVLAFHALFLAVVLTRADLPRWRLLPVLGGITYPLYLIHQHAGFMALDASAGRVSPWLALGMVMVTMLALAWAIYGYAEPRVRRAFDAALDAGARWRAASSAERRASNLQRQRAES